MNRQLALFMTAVQFLTRLPTPEIKAFESSWLARSARYFPLVGLLVGAINTAAWWLASRRLPASVAVGLSLAVSLLATGAFHEDGFADACDGFGGGASAERVLSIMKDSRVGAFGAIGIVMLLGLKWATLVGISEPDAGVALFAPLVIGAHVMSRWCAGALMWSLPYVRPEVGSKSRQVAQGFTAREWWVGGLMALAAFAPVAAACVRERGAIVLWALLAGAASAAAAAWAAAGYFRRRIGGHTGDCLGAAQQMCELCFLLGGLAIVHPAAVGMKGIGCSSI